MFFRSILLSLLLFIVGTVNTFGQAQDNLGSWYIYNGSFYFVPQIEFFFETQLRLYEPLSNREEFFLRPMVNYHFSPAFSAGLGYSYGMTWNYAEKEDDKIKSTEDRLIIQATFNQHIQRTRFQHRYRFEQRWLDDGNQQRFRYRLQVTIPLNNTSIEKGTVFLNTFDEIFIDSGPELKFNQNRLYLAGGFQFSKTLNFQIGYLFQSKPEHNFHRLQFFLTQKVNFYK